jgi:hypothetical protein
MVRIDFAPVLCAGDTGVFYLTNEENRLKKIARKGEKD